MITTKKSFIDKTSIEAREIVGIRFGKWASRVLGENLDPRFLNPIIGVSVEKSETIYNRLRDYWHNECLNSVSSPEPGSLTAELKDKGLIVIGKNGNYAFKGRENIDPATDKGIRHKRDTLGTSKTKPKSKRAQIRHRKERSA